MATLKELKEQNRKLKAKAELLREFSRREAEKKRLERENYRLRHPTQVRVLKKAKKYASNLAKNSQSSKKSNNNPFAMGLNNLNNNMFGTSKRGSRSIFG